MNKKILALTLAAAMTLSMAGCSSSDSSSSTTTTTTEASGDETIKVALIATTTGDYAMYGVPVANGANLYIDELNAAGGINGKQIEVLQYDDKADGTEAVNAFYLALDNDATAVIGAVLTGATIALADATYDEGMPQITASATSALVTQFEEDGDEIRENVFRSCFIDPFQGEKMADYAVGELGATTAAIFYETGSDYSEGLMASFVEKAAELGLEIVATEAFATGDMDFSAQMTNIAAAGADVVYLPFYYSDAGLAVTQGRAAGVTGTFMGADGMGGIAGFASAEDLEGTVYCSGYAPGSDSVLDFEAAYEATYGEAVPNMYAPLAYDAAMLLCAAIAEAEAAGLEAGSDEYKEAIIAALAANDGTEGITGSYSFDEYNNPIKSAAIMELQDGVESFTGLY
ncbi:ABC transporter substrate-binding protein [Bengtsoniella intestinalis]|uniref:ABC transporter substrate-binding protein n=1 Tax=Bengtsoniella intestinalis TaxID=3073143 RepID=UPI00391EF2B8